MGSTVNTIVTAVATAIIISSGAGVLIGTASVLAGGSVAGLVAVATNVAIIGATVVTANALTIKPRKRNSSLQQASYSQEVSNRSIMVKQPIIARETVYGDTKKSGGILFMEATGNNQELHIVLQLASHEINSIDKVYFDDAELTLASDGTDANSQTRFKVTAPSKFAGDSEFDSSRKAIRIKKHLGSDTQIADADLVNEVTKITSDHRFQGIAYLYLKLDYSSDMFPNGIPNISAEIEGKKVFDFRTESTVFSQNPAVCIFDYLTDTRIGLGVSRDNIDTTSFTTVANLCDQNETLSGGGTEKKYTLNGIVYSDIAPMEVIDDMLTSFVGSLSYSNGKFRLSGGQFVSPTKTLTEDDLAGHITLVTKQSRKDMFNTVKGIFTSEETNWQPTDYPMVTSSTFLSEDGESIFADIDLPFTTSSATAQRIAKIVLLKNRQSIMIKMKVKGQGFTLQVGDTVRVTNSRFGFSAKIFEIAELSVITDMTEFSVDLVLKETASSVYDWNAEESEFILDNTNLPTPTSVSSPSVSAVDELRTFSETPLAVLVVTCLSSDGSTNEFEVEAQNTAVSGSSFVSLGKSKNNVFELVNAQDGATYNIRARSVNAFNVYSDFTTIQHQVVGKTAPPSDVTNFSVNIINGVAELSWTPIPDLDLSHYVVRHTSDTVSPTFEEGVIMAEKVSKPGNTVSLPARTGTYMIKSIDVLGIESINSTKSQVILNNIDYNFNVVTTSTQSPNFTGTKSDCAVVSRSGTNFLQLQTGELFDDCTGLFDAQPGNFDDGGGTVDNLEGTYDFPTIDLGSIFTSRVTVNLVFERFDPTSLFDSFPGNFDQRDGLFDGAYTEFNDVNVEMQISLSNDNSTFTDFRSYVLGDYKARYIKLRAKLTTTNPTSAPAISTLSVTVDMPDRTFGEGSIASGTSASGKVVSYSPAFKEVQALGVSVSNLATGDFYEISNKTATGFTIVFKNSSGTVINRNFDYVAKGYGFLESS